MTNVKGLIKDSAGEPLDGRLVVTLNQFLIDNSTTPPSAHLTEPKTFTITNGELDINLLESETQQISYNFDFQLERPILDNDGNPTGDNEWVSFYSLDAIVPNQAEVNFVGLVPTNFSPDQLDTGVFAVAKVLANNEVYRNNLQFRLNYTGDYNASTIYKRDDVVVYDGSSFVYVNSSNTLGNVPPSYPNTSNSYWELVGLRGNTGTGTTGNDEVYGSNWDGQTDAPSRNAVYDKIETLAPINSPALTGSPTVPQPSAGDNSTLIPNTAWVANEFAPLDSPSLTGTPTAPTPTVSDDNTNLATTEFVKAVNNTDYFRANLTTDITDSTYSNWSSGKDVIFDSVEFDSANGYDDTTGIYTIPTTGLWQFYVSCFPETNDLIHVVYLDLVVSGETIRVGRYDFPDEVSKGPKQLIISGSVFQNVSLGDVVYSRITLLTPTAEGSSTDIRIKGSFNASQFWGICTRRTS